MVIDRRYLIGLSSQKPITRSSINIITDQTQRGLTRQRQKLLQ